MGFVNGIMVDSDLYPEAIEIKPMKYMKPPSEDKAKEYCQSGQYIFQIKKDGSHYILEKTKSGKIYLFGRTVSKKTGELTEKSANVPKIVKWAKDNLKPETILCGEIYYPGKTSKDTVHIMGSLPERAIELQKNNTIHYYIFDALMINGINLMNYGFEKRYSDLCEESFEWKFPPYIELASSFTGFDSFKTIQRYISEGEEGCVAKFKSGQYVPNKRPSYNWKWKRAVNDIDFVITKILSPEHFYDGKEIETWEYWQEKAKDGSWINCQIGCRYVDAQHNPDIFKPVTKAWYYNWAGAFEVGAYNDNDILVPIGRVSSGLTDEMKKDASENPDKYIGKVASVNCMSLDKNNHTFRHPYLTFAPRNDKDATECKIVEIFS